MKILMLLAILCVIGSISGTIVSVLIDDAPPVTILFGFGIGLIAILAASALQYSLFGKWHPTYLFED